MLALADRGCRVAGGVSAVLLLVGCTTSAPNAGPSSAATSPAASASLVACDTVEVRDVEAVPGDWVLAEYVLVRGPEGTRVTVTLPADAPATVAMGDSSEPGTSETRTAGLTVERATVTTDPASDLAPATLEAAIGQLGETPLSLTNAGQAGFSGELEAELGVAGTLVYRGAHQVAVTFTGACSGTAGGSVPVTGSARYFDLPEAGALDCDRRAEPGTLAAAAATFCSTG